MNTPGPISELLIAIALRDYWQVLLAVDHHGAPDTSRLVADTNLTATNVHTAIESLTRVGLLAHDPTDDGYRTTMAGSAFARFLRRLITDLNGPGNPPHSPTQPSTPPAPTHPRPARTREQAPTTGPHGGTIHRHRVPVDGHPHALTLPGPIVAVAARDPHHVEIWTLNQPHTPDTDHQLAVYGTGHHIPPGWTHIGTAITPDQRLVWHLLERQDRP